MYQVYHVVTGILKRTEPLGEAIPSGSLNGALEDTGADQGVPGPLPRMRVLPVDSNTHLLSTPRSGEQLELWPLPADQSAAG